MRLTPNFSLAEFLASETANENDIDNKPNAGELENITFTAIQLEIVRVICGNRRVSLTSGFRCEVLNELVGGSDSSDHRLGLAADVKIEGLNGIEIIRLIFRSNLKFDQLIDYGNNRVHIGFGKRMRRKLLLKTGSGYRPLAI